MGIFRAGLVACLLLGVVPRAEAIIVSGTNANGTANTDANAAPWLSSLGGIGLLTTNDESCSGTLFEPSLTYVLVAAHCLNGYDPSSNSYFVLSNGTTRYVNSVTVNPGFNNSTFQTDDIAIVQLKTAAPAGTPYYSIYTGSDNALVDMAFILAGEGDAGNGTLGDEALSPTNNSAYSYTTKTLRAGYNIFDGTSASLGTTGTDLYYQFVDPSNTYNTFDELSNSNSFPNPYSYHYSYNGITYYEASIASGDSGGPSFVNVNGQLEIAGIHSFTECFSGSSYNNSCVATPDGYGTVAADTDVSLFTNWIDSTIGVSNAPEPGTFGALGLGLGAVAYWRRRQLRTKNATEL